MGSAARAEPQPRLGLRPSRRLLRLASDERLVQQIQRGSEAAFEVAFERHSPAILGFCRHMLGSPEEAEDAVQHAFAAAYGDLQRGGEREIALKPWLFTIARNRCLSVLRARRELAVEEPELVTEGLAEQVERRSDLRRLLADVRELPEEQREALLLAEAGGLSQADIAAILGCEVARVKGLVYRARTALVARREARELACPDVREQLANLRGGALRRNELRLHLRDCPGCRDFREQVRQQRKLLAVALPVAPTLGLKSNVLAAVGLGGGGAAAAGGAAAGGAAVAGGAAGAGMLGGSAKVAALAALALGGVGGGTAVVVSQQHDPAPAKPPAAAQPLQGAPASVDRAADPATGQPAGTGSTAAPERTGQGGEGAHGRRGKQRASKRRDRAGLGREHGRGPIAAPPAETPVRRGPPEDKAKPENEPNGPKEQAKGPSAERRVQQGQAPAVGQGKAQTDEQATEQPEEAVEPEHPGRGRGKRDD